MNKCIFTEKISFIYSKLILNNSSSVGFQNFLSVFLQRIENKFFILAEKNIKI